MGITSLTKEQIAQSLIARLEEQTDDIRIETPLLEDYNSPDKIVQSSTNKTYHPDIMIIGNGETSIYEIELDQNMNPDKWRIMSMFTKLRRGEFYVIVPEPYLSKAEEVIIENNIKNIQLMYIPN